ncbi:MAG: SDR family oxidoreductase [Myxococcales bacterium]|nr:SDR family oxidoreductase [Myxococcales bacterium]MCB9575462.1 SDR family oxidoreductase [Polyangiaceae bacterium]
MSPPGVLVTGSAGYVGRLTVEALARRELSALVALDVAEPKERIDGVTYVSMSVCDPALADVIRDRGITHVVHLASILRPPPGKGPEFAYQVDVEGTRNVLEACVAHGVKKLIVTSSGAAYGYHADNKSWLTEDDPVRGNAEFPYSHHKRLIEEMLASHRREHPELAQLVFRPGTVIGPSVKSPVTDLFEKPAMIGVRGSDSPFVFIWDEDVVECLVRGVFSDATGTYNLAGDGALTPREIARVMGKPYLSVPAGLLGAALGVLQRLGKTQYGPEQVRFLRYRPVLSNRRLKEQFGYTPKWTSRQAFERYLASKDGHA